MLARLNADFQKFAHSVYVRSRNVRVAVGVVLLGAMIVVSTTAPANGASRSEAAVEKAFRAHLEAGNYAAALTEAQTLVPMIRASRGERSINYAAALTFVATSLLNLDRYREALPLYLQAIAIADALPKGNRNFAVALRGDLGGVYYEQGHLREAETVMREAAGMIDASVQPLTRWGLFNNLGNVLRLQGRYRDAEQMHRRALAIFESAPINRHSAASMQNLGITLMSQGRYAETEMLFKRALAIRERVLGPSHKEVAQNLLNLGALLADVEGRYADVIPLYERAITIQLTVLGAENDDLAMTLGNLATAYKGLGRQADAARVQLQALAIREKVLGPEHLDVALSLTNLGNIYGDEDRWDDAEKAQQRAVAIWNKSAPDSPAAAVPLTGLGRVYLHQGKFKDTEALFKKALAIRQAAFGPGHPSVSNSLDDLSMLASAQGKTTEALDLSRQAMNVLISDSASAVAAGQTRIGGAPEFGRNSYAFRRHVANLATAASQNIIPNAAAGLEAFEAAQWAGQSAAAAAVAQMGVRFAAGDDTLAALVRERQDLSAAWNDKDKNLISMRGRARSLQDRAAIQQLEMDLHGIETRLVAVSARLQREFPQYAALANPKPVKADDVQAMLAADEALVYFLLADEASYVFAVTKDAFAWHRLPLGVGALSAKVMAFRQGLDVDMIESENVLASVNKKRVLFDLGLANEVYAALLGPVDALIRGKANLLVVASGPLTALPFHLLVTEKPSATPTIDDLSPYRDAAWLIKRQAVSVLPSVASLGSLRLFSREGQGSKPLIGFGDPVFNPAAAATAEPSGARTRKAVRRATTRSYTDFWQGAALDRRQLGLSLTQLPDTADELRAVASNLGASAADIRLGRAATETAVKQAALADFRIVYFATHGLVAGDVKGLAEPSLALTIPARPSDVDDGLLTASEAAKLRLNADWVVLSACNTIAGDKPGADALSGLARAFFYAGARALLVSHWSVDSDSATRLTTATFGILKTDRTLGRAEALRRSMLAFLNDASQPENAYPAMWGALSIIGEGAAR